MPGDNTCTALEPCTYREDFETRELKGWASYPLWQDTAFDPWIRPNTMVPGDPNICLEQRFPAFWPEDTYAGAQKRLDLYLTPDSTVALRFYVKSHIAADLVAIRLAAGPHGALQHTVSQPRANGWKHVVFSFGDLAQENPGISGQDRIRIHALAVLARIPAADPEMSYFLGIDDVVVEAARMVPFRFIEPQVHELSEWKPRIPDRHYHRGGEFAIRGHWPVPAETVQVDIVPFTDRQTHPLSAELVGQGEEWAMPALPLDLPEGMYLATLRAARGGSIIADTELTVYIAPERERGSHPRLWFDGEGRQEMAARLQMPRFADVAAEIEERAERSRADLPIEAIVFDFDQLPDERMLEGHIYQVWFNRFARFKEAVFSNALAHALLKDEAAGEYGKDALVRLSGFPYWLNPWFEKRGQHTYYAITEGCQLALGYDLLYELMDAGERETVRRALWENDVRGCHRSYVEDNLVTSNTSNWVAMIAGGSLVTQASVCGDGPDAVLPEPYFTGALLKLHEMIRRSIDPSGAYGEGGYIGTSMHAWNLCLPIIERIFHIDLSEPIRGVYEEPIWTGNIMQKQLYQFGDSGGTGTSAPWLLAKYGDPLLGWAYRHYGGGVSLQDALHETDETTGHTPHDENPVRLFGDVGTTVFKSGWDEDDFIFVMRTGAFYNHHHLDQGSFWLADRGSVFIGERRGSHYWYYSQDPLFLSWYIQPIGHSTILIDGNPQSQRTGDPLDFAPGFDDRASIHHFLDGAHAAFTCGDIGRVYWGKVASLRRCALYLKPRAVLMIDVVEPGSRDVEATLLYQGLHYGDMAAGERASTIARGSNALVIHHLHPRSAEARVEEVPHYIQTLKDQQPLTKEGMLTVSARTEGAPLICANLLTTLRDVAVEDGVGHISGAAGGTAFACSSCLGVTFDVGDWRTDAVALTWASDRVFAALCTRLERSGAHLLTSTAPITCELSVGELRYCLAEAAEVTLAVPSRPEGVEVDGEPVIFDYDPGSRTVALQLSAGQGTVGCPTLGID